MPAIRIDLQTVFYVLKLIRCEVLGFLCYFIFIPPKHQCFTADFMPFVPSIFLVVLVNFMLDVSTLD